MPRSAATSVPSAIQTIGGNHQFYTELFDKIRRDAPGRRAKSSREDDAVIFVATMRYFWLKGRHARPPRPPVGFSPSANGSTPTEGSPAQAGTDSSDSP